MVDRAFLYGFKGYIGWSPWALVRVVLCANPNVINLRQSESGITLGPNPQALKGKLTHTYPQGSQAPTILKPST